MAAVRRPKLARYRRRDWPKANVSPASVRGLQQAMAALYGNDPGPTGDEAIAILEQRRRDDEARRLAQGCLALRQHTE